MIKTSADTGSYPHPGPCPAGGLPVPGGVHLMQKVQLVLLL